MKQTLCLELVEEGWDGECNTKKYETLSVLWACNLEEKRGTNATK